MSPDSRHVAWVLVDLQNAFESPGLHELASRVSKAVAAEPGDVFALLQENPPEGPLRRLRGWGGAGLATGQELLDEVADMAPERFTKSGYGAVTPLPTERLCRYDVVYVCGADTDACVLATALALFDAGVRLVVRAELCWTSAGRYFHESALAILARQLGPRRVCGGPTSGAPTGPDGAAGPGVPPTPRTRP